MAQSKMPKTCVIVGSALLNDESIMKMELEVVLTKHGKVRFYRNTDKNKEIYYLQRHGINTPPHRINHRANLSAIKKLGIKNIIAINSCGSLKKEIEPGSIVVPDDYIDFRNEFTFFDKEIKFTIPGLSSALRKKIIDAARKSRIKILDKGAYLQTRGPRLETKAEIKFFSTIADIVGMTLANEATLAKELGLNYASICIADNYANGIGRRKLTIKQLEEMQKKNTDKAKRLLNSVLKVVA
jgi:5'-methylthioadenosine phosphorylase